MNKKTRSATESVAFLAILGGILVVLNIVATNFHLGRFDFTRNEAFSLSEGSRSVARNLTDRLTITAYFSENLPPPYNATERYVQALLSEYQAASGGKIQVRFVNPDTEELRTQARDAGVQLVGSQLVQDDSVSVVEGFRGVAFEYMGERKAIPVIAETQGLEYQITMILKQLVGQKLKIGVLKGHEGPTPSQGLASFSGALPNYELIEVDASEPIGDDIAALLIIGPKTPLSDVELQNIDAFVMSGRGLGVFGGGVSVNLQGGAPSAQTVDTGLNRLLRPWGLEIRGDIVADARCNRIQIPTPMGRRLMQYPPWPIVVFEESAEDHPATFRLANAGLAFTSGLNRKTVPAGARVRVLGRSSEQSWSMTGETIDLAPPERGWMPSTTIGPFPLVAVVEGRLPSAFAGSSSMSAGEGGAALSPTGPARSERDVRVFVTGTSSIVSDDFVPPADQIGQEQLVALMALPLNVVDWLANDQALIAIRAKNVDEPALDVPSAVTMAEAEARSAAEQQDGDAVQSALRRRTDALEAWQAKKKAYRFANMLGIPLAFALFGVIRWRMRARKRESLSA